MPDNELIPIYTPGGGFYCKAGNPEAAEKLQREFIADFHPKLLPLYEGICLDKNSDDYGHPIFRPDAFDQGAPWCRSARNSATSTRSTGRSSRP